MTQNTHTNQLTRRGLLGALAGAAVARPVAAAALANPAGAAAPAGAPVHPDHGDNPDDIEHDGRAAERGACGCRECYRDRRAWADGLRPAGTALLAASNALGRLTEEHCTTWDCDVCLNADAFRVSIDRMVGLIESEGALHALPDAGRPYPDLPAQPAAVLALYDALDALLDTTDGHCDDWDCIACQDCDRLVTHVRLAVAHLDDGLDLPDALRVKEREPALAERKVERDREREGDGGAFMPHTAYEHLDAEGDVRLYRDSVQWLRRIAERRAKEEGGGVKAPTA